MRPEPNTFFDRAKVGINFEFANFIRIFANHYIIVTSKCKHYENFTLISVALVFATLWLASCQREPAVQPVTKADKTTLTKEVVTVGQLMAILNVSAIIKLKQ